MTLKPRRIVPKSKSPPRSRRRSPEKARRTCQVLEKSKFVKIIEE
jgi:hypothetical protein